MTPNSTTHCAPSYPFLWKVNGFWMQSLRRNWPIMWHDQIISLTQSRFKNLQYSISPCSPDHTFKGYMVPFDLFQQNCHSWHSINSLRLPLCDEYAEIINQTISSLFLQWLNKFTEFVRYSSPPLDWLPNIRHRRIWKIWKFCHIGEQI